MNIVKSTLRTDADVKKRSHIKVELKMHCSSLSVAFSAIFLCAETFINEAPGHQIPMLWIVE